MTVIYYYNGNAAATAFTIYYYGENSLVSTMIYETYPQKVYIGGIIKIEEL